MGMAVLWERYIPQGQIIRNEWAMAVILDEMAAIKGKDFD